MLLIYSISKKLWTPSAISVFVTRLILKGTSRYRPKLGICTNIDLKFRFIMSRNLAPALVDSLDFVEYSVADASPLRAIGTSDSNELPRGFVER